MEITIRIPMADGVTLPAAHMKKQLKSSYLTL